MVVTKDRQTFSLPPDLFQQIHMLLYPGEFLMSVHCCSYGWSQLLIGGFVYSRNWLWIPKSKSRLFHLHHGFHAYNCIGMWIWGADMQLVEESIVP